MGRGDEGGGPGDMLINGDVEGGRVKSSRVYDWESAIAIAPRGPEFGCLLGGNEAEDRPRVEQRRGP